MKMLRLVEGPELPAGATWWAVFTTEGDPPEPPVAIFQYVDHAQAWKRENYRDRSDVTVQPVMWAP